MNFFKVTPKDINLIDALAKCIEQNAGSVVNINQGCSSDKVMMGNGSTSVNPVNILTPQKGLTLAVHPRGYGEHYKFILLIYKNSFVDAHKICDVKY